MAKKGKSKPKGGGKPKVKPDRKRRLSGRTLAALGVCGVVFIALLIMRGMACVTFVRRAEVRIADLPRAFDGVTALFVSDVNISDAADEAGCEKLMAKLCALSPDMLLLGGDYSTGNLTDLLNRSPGSARPLAAEFMRSLADFPAPLGKYAVLGEEDDAEALSEACAYAGIQLLRDSGTYLEREGETLALVGLSDMSAGLTDCDAIARNFRREECVLVLAHNPAACTRIRVAEATGGGAWADLILSGHTLGGQVKLFGRTLRSFDDDPRYISGWYDAGGLPTLVSQGLGCRDVKLRLGTSSEVWFLTLRRAAGE